MSLKKLLCVLACSLLCASYVVAGKNSKKIKKSLTGKPFSENFVHALGKGQLQEFLLLNDVQKYLIETIERKGTITEGFLFALLLSLPSLRGKTLAVLGEYWDNFDEEECERLVKIIARIRYCFRDKFGKKILHEFDADLGDEMRHQILSLNASSL